MIEEAKFHDKIRITSGLSLEIFDEVYSGDRPGFLDGYKLLKNAIKPWGN